MSWLGRRPKLTEDQLREIREIVRGRDQYPSNNELARRYGVRPETIANYASGRGPKRYRDL